MLKGRARFIDPHTVVVETDKGEDRYVARNIIVAAIEVHRYLGADYLEDDYEFRSIPMEN